MMKPKIVKEQEAQMTPELKALKEAAWGKLRDLKGVSDQDADEAVDRFNSAADEAGLKSVKMVRRAQYRAAWGE